MNSHSPEEELDGVAFGEAPTLPPDFAPPQRHISVTSEDVEHAVDLARRVSEGEVQPDQARS